MKNTKVKKDGLKTSLRKFGHMLAHREMRGDVSESLKERAEKHRLMLRAFYKQR